MKTNRFLATAAISVALAFTFTGCTDDSGSDEDNNGGVSSSSGGGTTTPSSSSSGSTGGACDPSIAVQIGSQCWMKKNLDIEMEDSWCYENDPANCETYGRLYDWETALTVCPSGWHLPSDEEWQTLVDFAGGEETAGTKLKAASGWVDESCEQMGGTITCPLSTDTYGFAALPGGAGFADGDYFKGAGYVGLWWSSSEDNSDEAWIRDMGYGYEDVYRDSSEKIRLFSVRCIQD
jgi:uncharacterized protein (TIGR02145 family)